MKNIFPSRRGGFRRLLVFKHSFPLTPALSRRERERRIPRSADRDATALRGLADFPPLPAGEGRGEGERRKLPQTLAPSHFRSLLPHLCLAQIFGFFLLLSASAQIPAPTDAPKPRTPEESAAAFKLPAGFRMEVVASESLIASPSGIAWDERGRMFVSELHGYNLAGQLDIEEGASQFLAMRQIRQVRRAVRE